MRYIEFCSTRTAKQIHRLIEARTAIDDRARLTLRDLRKLRIKADADRKEREEYLDFLPRMYSLQSRFPEGEPDSELKFNPPKHNLKRKHRKPREPRLP